MGAGEERQEGGGQHTTAGVREQSFLLAPRAQSC